jgi:hypothetical protein
VEQTGQSQVRHKDKVISRDQQEALTKTKWRRFETAVCGIKYRGWELRLDWIWIRMIFSKADGCWRAWCENALALMNDEPFTGSLAVAKEKVCGALLLRLKNGIDWIWRHAT